MKYNENVNEINTRLETYSFSRADIEELDLLLEEFKIKVKEEIK